jgi:hypothetical protein
MTSQLNERHDLKTATDELRDAVLEAGPSKDVHRTAMREISAADPEFFLDFTLAFANYVNDQPGEVDDDTEAALTALFTDHRDTVVVAHDAGAARLAAALENLGIALRLAPKDSPAK